MSNVIDQLAGLGNDVEQAAPADIARRDLLRGRAALRRRRFGRAVTGLGATAAVTLAAVAVTATQSSPGPAPTSTDLDLVAYTGPQVPGFTVGKVPEGFVLQGSTPYSLDVARPDDQTSLDDFGHKLVVLLRSPELTDIPDGTTVEVNGQPGTISNFDPTATQLFYSDGSHEIVVQAWNDLGLTDQELVEFAASVTVTADATAARG